VNLCLLAHIQSGEIDIGRLTVPVSRTMVLQGGIVLEEQPPFGETFAGAFGGETLLRDPLAVPGGLLSIVAPGALPQRLRQLYAETVSGGLTSVTATAELVGTPVTDKRNLIAEEGTALSLPLRVKLDNAFLGSGCYIGSVANPLVLHLTTGMTEPPPPAVPIKGKAGFIEARDKLEFIVLQGNSLVDNSFSVPRASGCGGPLSSLLDPVIDAKLSLPSPAGHNAAILNGPVEEATTVGVIASEK
jgi:hypothetical protein